MEKFEDFDSNVHKIEMEQKRNLLRTIFLNLLMIFFIVLCYFYISEFFGAVSSFYIETNGFSIHFGASLLLFSFLVILAGPFVGFISGFLGEFLVQLAFYSTMYIEWCIILGIFGFLCGYYKYKPLKYSDMKNVYLTFIALFLSFMLTTFLIISYYSILYFNQMERK